MEAFVYCWTDWKTKMLYVGRHKGTPNDGYICSSMTMLKEYKSRPGDFTREILATGPYSVMISFEVAILTAANAAKDPMFYNKHNGSKKFAFVGKGQRRPHYRNKGLTGKWKRSVDHNQQQSLYQKNNSCFVSNNPMNEPEKRKLVSLSKIGRKKFTNIQTQQNKMFLPGTEPTGFVLVVEG